MIRPSCDSSTWTRRTDYRVTEVSLTDDASSDSVLRGEQLHDGVPWRLDEPCTARILEIVAVD